MAYNQYNNGNQFDQQNNIYKTESEYSQFRNNEAGPLDHLSDGLQGQARTAFIGKVYSLLTLQLLITFSFCLVAQYSQSYRDFQLDNAWVLFIPIGLLIFTMIVAFCVNKARQTPFNLILLLVFILSFSYIVSFSCSAIVSSMDDQQPIVPIAAGATVGLTLVLTIYAFLCKGNFLAWMGIILVCASVGLVIGITCIFVRIPMLGIVLCVLGVIIYGIYLVIITKMIIGGQMAKFPLDSAIIASVFLYIYIMRIFLYILALVARLKK